MVLILSRRLTRYSISPDKDECADKTDNCHSSARCDNIVGFFNCTCLQGFTGDGVTCSGMDDSLMLFSRGQLCSASLAISSSSVMALIQAFLSPTFLYFEPLCRYNFLFISLSPLITFLDP